MKVEEGRRPELSGSSRGLASYCGQLHKLAHRYQRPLLQAGTPCLVKVASRQSTQHFFFFLKSDVYLSGPRPGDIKNLPIYPGRKIGERQGPGPQPGEESGRGRQSKVLSRPTAPASGRRSAVDRLWPHEVLQKGKLRFWAVRAGPSDRVRGWGGGGGGCLGRSQPAMFLLVLPALLTQSDASLFPSYCLWK